MTQKLPTNECRRILRAYAAGESEREVARRCGVSPSAVRRLVRAVVASEWPDYVRRSEDAG